MKKIHWIIPTLIIILSYTLPISAQEEKILIIESYHHTYPWDASYKKGLEKILGKRYDLVTFEMDTKRIPKSEYETQADLAFDTYKQLNPELIILGDDNALKYVGPKFVNTKTPVVYLGINQNPRNYGMFGPENITGVLERPLMKRSIVYLSEIYTSDLKKVLIMFDNGTTSHSSVEQVFRGRHSITIAGIQADLKQIRHLQEWQQTVLNAKDEGYDAIIVGLYQTIVDGNGDHVPSDTLIAWTSKNTPIPPFGFWDFTVGPKKTIGGLVLFGEVQGETAGKMAIEILTKGKIPYEIRPVVAKKGRLLFSTSQLERWQEKISLPEKIKSEATFIE